jgi:hypothetical protein
MSTRLDLVLQKHPDHADGIRLLASRDPSGNLKYLDWAGKVLASGQALAPEIADILELFHKFRGQTPNPVPHGARHNRRAPRSERIHPDIHTYRPHDLANLRTNLLKMKRAQDGKRRKRERLYKIEGSVEADLVHDSPDLVVRHIKNKNASVHYGHGTKWCISMLRENYFEDYESHNATFFFFERKIPLNNEFDKVALMVPRSGANDVEYGEATTAFTTLDQRVDMMALAKVYGPHIFDIFREIHARSEQYPGSAMAMVYAGTATQEQIETVFDKIGVLTPHETRSVLRAICCNDAAPEALLEKIALRASALSKRKPPRRRHHFRQTDDLVRNVMAAMVIHPNVSAEAREKLAKGLRRRRVNIDLIHRTVYNGRIEVSCERDGNRYRRRRVRRRQMTVKELQKRAGVLERLAARTRKKAETLERKLAEKAKKKAEKQKPIRRKQRP